MLRQPYLVTSWMGDQLNGGTNQMGDFYFCTFLCWLAACFLKSAPWIINRLHKHQRDEQIYRKAVAWASSNQTSPHHGILRRLIEIWFVLQLEISAKEVAMIDWMLERCYTAFHHEMYMRNNSLILRETSTLWLHMIWIIEKLGERIMLLLKCLFQFCSKDQYHPFHRSASFS